MNAVEWRATSGLALVYALRMLGMFMVLPVLALYARALPGGATALQIGLAVGVYGLTQASLQVPIGLLSDRLGRKPVIVTGLLVFAAGSVVAARAHTIEGVIAGRALQGAGAISSAVAALVADITRVEVRSQAMMVLGIGMGGAFLLSLIVGPLLDGLIGVDGIFLLTAGLALLAMPVVALFVPSAPRALLPAESGLGRVLADPALLRLDAGIFLLHAAMTALFVVMPLALQDALGLPGSGHWKIYLPVMLATAIVVFPAMRRVERAGRVREAYVAAIGSLAAAGACAALWPLRAAGLVAAVTLFFLGFNFLEGTLPSLISRLAPPEAKGAALGVYSTAQFLGAFAGGSLGGWSLGRFGPAGAFAVVAVLPLIWLTFAHRLKLESHTTNHD